MRRLNETNWRVSLTTSDGTPIEKMIIAPTMDIAMSRARQSFPGQQFVTATATQLDPQLDTPTAQATAQNMLPKQLQPLQPLKQLMQPGQQLQRESFPIDISAINYPYSITLPARFKHILRENSPVQVHDNHGQYCIILENSTNMKTFLRNLRRSSDRNAATTIVSGIRSSI